MMQQQKEVWFCVMNKNIVFTDLQSLIMQPGGNKSQSIILPLQV